MTETLAADFFALLLQSEVVQRFGWGLLHSLWQIAALAGLYYLVRLVIPKRFLSLRYHFGYAVLLLMLALPMATAMLMPTGESAECKVQSAELMANTDLPTGAFADASGSGLLNSDFNALGSSPAGAVSMEEFVAIVGEDAVAEAFAEVDNQSLPRKQRPQNADLPTGAFADASGSGLLNSGYFAISQYLWILPVLWLVGVIFLSVQLASGLLGVGRLRRAARPPVDDEWLDRLAKLCRSLQVRQKVQLLVSRTIDSPVLIGLFRPAILVPMSFLSGFTPEEVEAILVHELAHIRRHDYLANLVQMLLETLLFYHPLLWLVSNAVREDREYICDEFVVRRHGTSSLFYAKTLTHLEQFRQTGGNDMKRMLYTPAAAARPLLNRVRHILGLKKESDRTCGGVAGLILLILLMLSPLCFALLQDESAELVADDNQSRDSNGAVAVEVSAENEQSVDHAWEFNTNTTQEDTKFFAEELNRVAKTLTDTANSLNSTPSSDSTLSTTPSGIFMPFPKFQSRQDIERFFQSAAAAGKYPHVRKAGLSSMSLGNRGAESSKIDTQIIFTSLRTEDWLKDDAGQQITREEGFEQFIQAVEAADGFDRVWVYFAYDAGPSGISDEATEIGIVFTLAEPLPAHAKRSPAIFLVEQETGSGLFFVGSQMDLIAEKLRNGEKLLSIDIKNLGKTPEVGNSTLQTPNSTLPPADSVTSKLYLLKNALELFEEDSFVSTYLGNRITPMKLGKFDATSTKHNNLLVTGTERVHEEMRKIMAEIDAIVESEEFKASREINVAEKPEIKVFKIKHTQAASLMSMFESLQIDPEMLFSADMPTNSMLVKASPETIKTIEELITQLDTEPVNKQPQAYASYGAYGSYSAPTQQQATPQPTQQTQLFFAPQAPSSSASSYSGITHPEANIHPIPPAGVGVSEPTGPAPTVRSARPTPAHPEPGHPAPPKPGGYWGTSTYHHPAPSGTTSSNYSSTLDTPPKPGEHPAPPAPAK